MIQPHPDCRAPHREAYEYQGPTHACVGSGCVAPECVTRALDTAAAESIKRVLVIPTDEQKEIG